MFNAQGEADQENTQDVMNVTFNRSSDNFFAGGQSPKTSEYPDDFFDVEKKDSLKLSSGEFEAFDQIKEAKVKARPSETKIETKPEKKRKKRTPMLKLSPGERQRQRRELSASPEQ